jgi:hypothetical protein
MISTKNDLNKREKTTKSRKFYQLHFDLRYMELVAECRDLSLEVGCKLK